MSVKSRFIVRNVDGIMPKGLTDDVKKVFNEIAEATNAQSSEAIMVNGAVMILGNKKITTQTKIQITNPQILTDHALKAEKEVREKIRKLKVDLDLNQTETKKLVDTYNIDKKRLENKEIDLRIKKELLEKLAKEIKEKSVEEKLLDELTSNQDQLYKVLDSIEVNKSNFSQEVKKEIAGMNENLCNRTKEFAKEIMEVH